MDADDISMPDRFQVQIEFMIQNPNISVLGTNVCEFYKEPGDLNNYKHVPLNHKEITSYSKYRNPLNHPSVVFRKRHVFESGSYQNMPFFEDYFLWVRMLKRGYQFQNLNESVSECGRWCIIRLIKRELSHNEFEKWFKLIKYPNMNNDELVTMLTYLI